MKKKILMGSISFLVGLILCESELIETLIQYRIPDEKKIEKISLSVWLCSEKVKEMKDEFSVSWPTCLVE